MKLFKALLLLSLVTSLFSCNEKYNVEYVSIQFSYVVTDCFNCEHPYTIRAIDLTSVSAKEYDEYENKYGKSIAGDVYKISYTGELSYNSINNNPIFYNCKSVKIKRIPAKVVSLVIRIDDEGRMILEPVKNDVFDTPFMVEQLSYVVTSNEGYSNFKYLNEYSDGDIVYLTYNYHPVDNSLIKSDNVFYGFNPR